MRVRYAYPPEDSGFAPVILQNIGRRIRGKIIAIEELDGSTQVFVTFTTRCMEQACAYGFLATTGGKFRLATLPQRDTQKTTVWHGVSWPSHEMTRAQGGSQAELDEVYAAKLRRGHQHTIELEVAQSR